MADGSERKFRVTVQVWGRDCDGPFEHYTEEQELDYFKLAQLVGLKTLHNGACTWQENSDGDSGQIQFHQEIENEGHRQTLVTFRKIAVGAA